MRHVRGTSTHQKGVQGLKPPQPVMQDHSPCTWDCWKLFPGAKWKFPATCRGYFFSFSSYVLPLPAEDLHGPLLHGAAFPAQLSPAALPCLDPSWYLVNFQEAIHLAAFILLLLHLLAEALSPALLNSVWVLKGPASTAISLPYIFTGVTAPIGDEAWGEECDQCWPLGNKA